MKIKVGDKVKVIAGKDKNKEGIVTKTLRNDNKIVIEGINIIKKHMKPNQQNETGGILEMEAPIHVSNVKKIDVKVKKESKIKKESKES